MNQILVLSGDADFRRDNIDLLSKNGFTVVDASSFADGLAKIGEASFDVVIIDEELSDYDGFEACRKIRQDSNIPIILTGTGTYTEVQDKLEDASYNVYLSKPIDNTELLSAIQAIVVKPKPKKKRKRSVAKGKKSVSARKTRETPPADAGTTDEEDNETQQAVPEYKPLTSDVLVSPMVKKDLKPEPLIPRPVKPDRSLKNKPVISDKHPFTQNINRVFCTFCGHENHKWHRFCSSCGQEIKTTGIHIHNGEESEKAPVPISEEKPLESIIAGEITPEEKIEEQVPITEDIPQEEELLPAEESTGEMFKQLETVESLPEEPVPVTESSTEQEITKQEPVMEEIPLEKEPAAADESSEEMIKQPEAVEEMPEEPVEEVIELPEPVGNMPEELLTAAEYSTEQYSTEQEPTVEEIQEEREPSLVNEYLTEQADIQQEPVMEGIPEEREPAISEDVLKEDEVRPETPVMEEIPEEKEPLPVNESTEELFNQPEPVENEPEELIPEYEQPTEEESGEKEPVMSYNLDENLPPSEPPAQEVEPAPDESSIIEETPSLKINSSGTDNERDSGYQNGGLQIWEDGRAVKLVEAMVLGKVSDIEPVIDLSSKEGYSFPQINSIIDGDDEDTNHTLQFLEKANILIKKPYEKLLMDPDGTFQLIPQERCPKCDSSNLISGQLVEHFACGYVGMEQDFRTDHKYVCPKCHRDMKLIGTDYRNAGLHYRCLNCNEIFPNPVIKWRSLTTRKTWNANDLKHVWIYSYSFSPDKKEWLEFQLKPKTQLIEFLRGRGYEVQESAQMPGSSGAVHIIDILAVRDDIMTKINLGIGILVAMPGEDEVRLEELFKYDTRAYDIGINYKVVIAIPKLNYEAVKFAERQVIGTFEAKTLGSLVAQITSRSKDTDNIINKGGEQVAYDEQQAATKSDPASILIRFLKKRGYEVFEKAKIIGKSGAEYVFDIIARREDGIVVPTIAIDMAILSSGQEVDINEISQFDSEAYDAGIRNKVFVGIPGISRQALQFAHQQRIKTIEAGDLEKYM
jgi:DNA-binding response OmpR family regulator